MAGDRVTLSLKGTVPIDLLARALTNFSSLVNALARDVAKGAKIEWVVEELSAGSADATIVGLSDDMWAVERVVEAYSEVGSSAEAGRPIPYSPAVRERTNKILGLLNGKVSAVTFEAMDQPPHTVTSNALPSPTERQLTSAYGSVEGKIHSLLGREPGIRFTLYDALFNRAVLCYFSADATERQKQEDLMRPLWEKRAIVQGLVTRDSLTDRPLEVRQINRVQPVIIGDFRAARGVLSHLHTEPAEDTIRRARDA